MTQKLILPLYAKKPRSGDITNIVNEDAFPTIEAIITAYPKAMISTGLASKLRLKP